MAANAVESINKVAQPEASGKAALAPTPTTVSDSTNTTDTKAPSSTSDTSAPPIAADADTGKTAEAPLAPAPIVTQPTTAAKEGASVPVVGPANEETPSIANGDLCSKVDATDTLSEQPEKQTDQTPTPVSQPPATGNTTAAAEAGTSDKLVPKPVSVEEVSDKGTPVVNPPTAVTLNTTSSQSDNMAETMAPETAFEPVPEKSEPEIGDKRKVDEVANDSAEAKPTLNGTAGHDDDDDEPADKKQKSNGENTNGTAPKKPGRPKKEKKAPAPVGKTLRKTRSQGAAEIQ